MFELDITKDTAKTKGNQAKTVEQEPVCNYHDI